MYRILTLKNRLITILFCSLFFIYMFFYRSKNLFKNLSSPNCVNYHLNKNLFRLTPENVGSYSRVIIVVSKRVEKRII